VNRFAAAVLVASFSCLLVADWSGVRFALTHYAPVTREEPPDCYAPSLVASCEPDCEVTPAKVADCEGGCSVAPSVLATSCKGDECFVPPVDDCGDPPDCLTGATS
jgi:hypothetical protein